MAQHDVQTVLDCYQQGQSVKEIASQCGISPSYVYRILGGHGLINGQRRGFRPECTDRNTTIATLFREGKTMQEIGDLYGVTRARVQQILKKVGLSRRDGGHYVVTDRVGRVRDQQRQQSEARYLERYAMRKVDVLRINERYGKVVKPTTAFSAQCDNARGWNHEWHLSFAEWWGVWERSGKWHQRGRQRGKYCMARINPLRPFEKDNVQIVKLGDLMRSQSVEG